MTQSTAVRLVTELALANRGFAAVPSGGVDGNALVKSGTGLAWGSGAGGTAVNSVNGRTGAVTLAAIDVGLSNVNNTSDIAKPISALTATALAGKADYPVGGSNGQVLTKSGTTTSWTTVSGGGAGGGSILAPSPSGSDDTATLQALLLQAQATGGGTLELRAGTYLVTNLVTNQSFNQPRIVGQGRNYTTLQGTSSTGSILKLKGGSGQGSGGYLADFTITGLAGAVGLEIADACGVTGERLRFSGALSVGLRFHNEAASAFSEFNVISAEFLSTVAMSVHYRRSGGAESFHGSGLGEGSLINQSGGTTGPEIQVDDGCFPYEAPLFVQFFTRVTVPLIKYLNATASRPGHFYGVIRIDNFVNNAVLVDPTSTKPLLFAGDVLPFGSDGFTVGSLLEVDSAYYTSSSGIVRRDKVSMVATVPTTSNSVGTPGQISQDGAFIYVCTATNTWARAALVTW